MSQQEKSARVVYARAETPTALVNTGQDGGRGNGWGQGAPPVGNLGHVRLPVVVVWTDDDDMGSEWSLRDRLMLSPGYRSAFGDASTSHRLRSG